MRIIAPGLAGQHNGKPVVNPASLQCPDKGWFAEAACSHVYYNCAFKGDNPAAQECAAGQRITSLQYSAGLPHHFHPGHHSVWAHQGARRGFRNGDGSHLHKSRNAAP